MANFELAVSKILEREGGSTYTNDPEDPGGETKFGISKAAHPKEDIANLTEDRAKEIYRANYWDPIRGDDVERQDIAEVIFDTAVNMGVYTAIRMTQKAAGTYPDGIMGVKTLGVLNTEFEFENPKFFFNAFFVAKVKYYASICNRKPSQKKYLLGWINRALKGVK